MNNTLGIITEYNPFHNGHLYNIEKGKTISKSENVIVAMSGNFVQRGQPAIIDKYKRCEMALIGGADLCLEIPTPYVLESAENFSKCGVSIFDKSNIVDNIVFGSESGNIDSLSHIATFLLYENIEYKLALKKNLDLGISYPKAVSTTLKSFGFNENFTANNTLAIQYLIALQEQSSKIKAYTVKREGSNYHDNTINDSTLGASATAIREILHNSKNIELAKGYIPENIYELFQKEVTQNFTSIDNLSDIFHYRLATMTITELQNINHVSEGIENLILNTSNKFYLISDILEQCTSKRYTKSKISRIILSIILDIKKDGTSKTCPPYIRVLGYKKEKEFLLKDLIKKSSLPVIVNLNKSFLPPEAKKMLEDEKKYSKIYNLSFNSKKTSKFDEVQSKPIII
ncbi:MAG: nucleotidyltransferase [Lachnospirales bacterium]